MFRHHVAVVLCLACVAALAACTPWPQSRLPRGDWEVTAGGTVHATDLRYLTLVGAAYDEPAAPAAERLLRFLDEVGPAWRMPEHITYYAFPDRETLQALTGWDTNGRAILAHDATVSVHAADAHEVMHLLTTPAGRPLRLANFWMEGVAMAYTWPEVYFDAATLSERGLPPRLGAWYGLTANGPRQRPADPRARRAAGPHATGTRQPSVPGAARRHHLPRRRLLRHLPAGAGAHRPRAHRGLPGVPRRGQPGRRRGRGAGGLRAAPRRPSRGSGGRLARLSRRLGRGGGPLVAGRSQPG